MRFVLYTDKTIKQALSALDERIQAKSTLEGWTKKDKNSKDQGRFQLETATQVAGRFNRVTALRGLLEREGKMTVIKGKVPEGATPRQVALVFGALTLVGLAMMVNGQVILGLGAVAMGAALYVPLTGDRVNSAHLVKELRAALKAKDKPPKV